MLAYRNPRLEAKQIRDFDKELPAVIDVTSPSACDRSRERIQCQVLQVAIVANVEGCPRMQEVGDEKVSIELPGGF